MLIYSMCGSLAISLVDSYVYDINAANINKGNNAVIITSLKEIKEITNRLFGILKKKKLTISI